MFISPFQYFLGDGRPLRQNGFPGEEFIPNQSMVLILILESVTLGVGAREGTWRRSAA